MGGAREIDGGLAQLGERLICIQEVNGSIPLFSTRTPDKTVQCQIGTKRSCFDLKRSGSEMSELWLSVKARDMKLAATTGP